MYINIAPGEEKQPKSNFNDRFCEEPNFAHVFPMRRYIHQIQRHTSLKSVKYFDQRLFHYSEKSVLDTDFFLSKNMLQNENLLEQINI